jgi:hypothetical protein
MPIAANREYRRCRGNSKPRHAQRGHPRKQQDGKGRPEIVEDSARDEEQVRRHPSRRLTVERPFGGDLSGGFGRHRRSKLADKMGSLNAESEVSGRKILQFFMGTAP